MARRMAVIIGKMEKYWRNRTDGERGKVYVKISKHQ